MAFTRKAKIGAAAAAVVVLGVLGVLAFGWFEVQQLWLDDEVDEDLTTFADPGDEPGSAATTSTAPGDGSEESPATSEQPAPAEAVLVRSGSFAGVEGHTVSGEVNLIGQPDGTFIVQFPDLDAQNGPDLVVWLTNEDTSTPVVDLGELKGNQGSQEYVVPSGTALEDFDTVVIWCRRFSVGFAEAPLA